MYYFSQTCLRLTAVRAGRGATAQRIEDKHSTRKTSFAFLTVFTDSPTFGLFEQVIFAEWN